MQFTSTKYNVTSSGYPKRDFTICAVVVTNFNSSYRRSQDSVVGIVTRLQPRKQRNSRSISGKGISQLSKWLWGPASALYKGYQRLLSAGQSDLSWRKTHFHFRNKMKMRGAITPLRLLLQGVVFKNGKNFPLITKKYGFLKYGERLKRVQISYEKK